VPISTTPTKKPTPFTVVLASKYGFVKVRFSVSVTLTRMLACLPKVVTAIAVAVVDVVAAVVVTTIAVVAAVAAEAAAAVAVADAAR
jgi:hypothetical protein